MSPIELCKISDPNWLEYRKIGASDVAAIIGLNPYRSKFAVFLEKVGEAPPVEENETMLLGKLFEPIIAQEFARRTNLKIEKDLVVWQHPRVKCMTASPDYRVWEDGKEGVLEIKKAGHWASKDYDDDAIADAAHVQLLAQMAVTGLTFGYVCAMLGGDRIVWKRIERDNDLIQRIECECIDFWHLVENRTPPSLAASDTDLMSAMFPHALKEPIILGSKAAHYAQEYLNAKAQAKHFDALADEAKANLQLEIGEHEAAETGNYRISWKNQMRETLDSKALRSKHPEIALQFCRVSEFRKFDVKEVKKGDK